MRSVDYKVKTIFPLSVFTLALVLRHALRGHLPLTCFHQENAGQAEKSRRIHEMSLGARSRGKILCDFPPQDLAGDRLSPRTLKGLALKAFRKFQPLA